MTKAVLDLAKALINATLLLAALCLFLGWQLFSSVESLTDQLVSTRDNLSSVHQGITELRAEVGQIRSAIASGRAIDTQLAERLDAIEMRISDAQVTMAAQLATIDQTAIAAAEAFAASLVRSLAEAFSQG